MNVFIKNKNYRKFTIVSLLSGIGNILFYLALVTYASVKHINRTMIDRSLSYN